jgi:hypothetical protein
VSVELLRLDYDRTADLLKTLTDVRFKLLALVPTVTGTAIGLLGDPSSAAELLGVGVLGLTATAGLLLYELRNTVLYVYALERAETLEGLLQLPSGGLYRERPRGAGHDAGLSLVYGAALGGWTYLVAWGGLRGLDVGRPRVAGAVIGLCVGIMAVAALLRATSRPRDRATAGAAAPAAPG